MESMDNFRERFEALEQRTEQLQQRIYTVERRRRWWRLPWRVAVVVALGLALVLPLTVQAKTFHCDAGDVTCLIAAINQANANGDKNTIRLQAGTYTLTAVDNDENGLPVITSPLTITGEGAETTTIERAAGAPGFRLFMVAASGTLSLERLTLRGGVGGVGFGSSGGGIANSGTLTVTQSTITNNFADSGGGIANSGTATIANSTIASNEGGLSGGGRSSTAAR